MNFSFLTTENVFKRYSESKSYTEKLTEPFDEFERIALNKPFDGIDPRYPKTTDGTTASIIRKTGKRVVQQLPTGVITSDDESAWLPIIAQFIYTNKILPYANDEYDLIQKCWTYIEKSLTFGAAATYTPLLNHDGYICPDVTSPYWGDIFIQPGKKSGYSSNYIFLRSWWQQEDIEALIKGEQALARDARKRGEKYESTWDLNALKEVKRAITAKDEQARTPSEEDRGVSPEGIELVTGFQKGVGAKFFTFNPDKKTIVRTKINKDPRGKMPIDWLYGDIDGSNPLGRGLVELIGGLQNLIDSDMQMYQFNRALMLAPPVVKRGNFNKNKIVYAPNVIIDVGSDPEASVEPLTIDTSAVINYPDLYGLQKSQLLNLVSSPDTSIGADIGNPGFGKTPTAINTQKANVSVDDNYVRKMFEAWWENWSETAINLFFAERTGIEELQLDTDTANKLRKLADEGKFDPAQISEENKVMIDYDTATPALKFRVDASTSKMKDDADQLEALSGLLTTVRENPILAQLVPQEKILGAWNAIVAASGIEDPELLSIDIEEFKQQQEAAMEEQMVAEQMAQEMPQEEPQLPAELPQPIEGEVVEQPVEPSEDEQIAEMLTNLGFGEEVVVRAIQMADEGFSTDEILQEIGVANV